MRYKTLLENVKLQSLLTQSFVILFNYACNTTLYKGRDSKGDKVAVQQFVNQQSEPCR